jgi:hypothetical protein
MRRSDYRGIDAARLRQGAVRARRTEGGCAWCTKSGRGQSSPAVYADRFLPPGIPGDFTARPGAAYVRTEGVNSKGRKFANFYHFAPCGDHLVLVDIAENPL